MSRVLRLKSGPWLDVLLGAGLVVAGQFEVWTGDEPTFSAAAVAAAGTLPLMVRSLAPVAVLLVCVAALTLLTLQRVDEFTVAQLLGLMLATYTVAARVSLRPALGALGLVIVAAWANSAASGISVPGDYVFAVILLAVPWAAGASIRRWRERTLELRRLTAALDAERETHAALAVEAERGRIARDLHDSFAQSLNAMVVHAEAAQASLAGNLAQAEKSLDRIQEVGRGSLRETRQLLAGLRENSDPGSLRISDLERLAETARAEGFAVDLVVAGNVEAPPGPVQAAVYRIVQESLTNSVKHSSGRQVNVEVEVEDDAVRVVVTDDGPTSPSAGPGIGGLGLIGMRERAHLLGGKCHAGPTDQGYRVYAHLPMAGP